MFDSVISCFKNARATEPIPAKLEAFLLNRRHRDKVLAVRAANPEQRTELKKSVPAATISGTFKVRNMEGLQYYNGLICLDFDGKENPWFTPETMKAQLAEYEEVMYAGLSVSGNGVFAIIPTNNQNPEAHPMVVDILGKIFAEENNLIYDRACKDVCRLRFISVDDSPVWNPTPAIFDAQSILPRMGDQVRKPRPIRFTRPTSGSEGNRDKVEQYIQAVESCGQDVTYNYDDWIKLGMAIAAEFGSEGESYFMRISQISSKFDHDYATKKYQHLVRNVHRIKLGTFFKILQNQGIKP